MIQANASHHDLALNIGSGDLDFMAEQKKLKLYDTLIEDVRVLSGVKPDLASIIRCFFGRAGFQAVVYYRMAAALRGSNIFGRILARMFVRMNISANACDIDPTAVIGPGLKLPHPCGIVIGPCLIGRNAMILQNTTIGLRHFSADELDPANFPRIGDNVILSAGARLVGAIEVGDNVAVGANAVVLTDVPSNCTAVGVPARIIRKK